MAELVRRRDIAQQAIDSGKWSVAAANRALAPWAAIAIRAGADVPPLRGALADEADRARQSWRDFSTSRIDAVSRALLADDICQREQWAPLLIEARNRSLDRFTQPTPPAEAETDRAIALTILCNLFGLPGWRPPTVTDAPERIAA